MRSTPDAADVVTPMSSASSSSINERDLKQRKVVNDEQQSTPNVDRMAPVFLRMNFKKHSELEEPDIRVEGDAKYFSRPWQERNTMVPLLIAFRVQFPDLFIGTPDLGPQDIEEGIEGEAPSVEVQEFMCGLLTLAANRLKPVEYPQYNRPLNDCVANHYANRGDPMWEGSNPLASGRRFPDLKPDDRLRLMYCLLDWALTESKVVREKIEETYKNRNAARAGILNPCDSHFIGKDDKKHSYYLLKGLNTRFRLYIQTDTNTTPCRWYSVCSTLEQLRAFTTDLSNNTKTVRGRKIVDDLASIHIPEIERAEQFRLQQSQKKARAEYERNRRAMYAADAAIQPMERSSRTRGKRVDYNHMLQGQGEDEDGNPHGKRGQTDSPDSSVHLSSSRSGRMLKRPRDWEEGSPNSDTRTPLINSLYGDMTYDAPKGWASKEQEEPESDVIILHYNKEKFRNWSRPKADLNCAHRYTQPFEETKTHLRPESSIGRIAPDVAVPGQQPLESTLDRTVDSSIQATSTPTIVESKTANEQSTSRLAFEPESRATNPEDTSREPRIDKLSGQETSGLNVHADLKHSKNLARDSRCLVFITTWTASPNDSNLSEVLSRMIDHAILHNINTVDILLCAPSDRQVFSSSADFTSLQKLLSSLYIRAALLARTKSATVEFTVIFENWCGYDLAQEDFVWSAVGGTSSDEELMKDFSIRYHNAYPTKQIPQILLTAEVETESEMSISRPAEARQYEVVALGGTFDHLHAGHKILLTMAAWLAQKRLLVGITDDALLTNKKFKEVMQNITQRTKCVELFMYRIKRGIIYQLVPIADVAGPTATDATLQALVASRETEAGSNQIRDIRARNNLPSMDFFFIDVIGPEGEVTGEQMDQLKLSSTAIRARIASKL